jgi:hypothetical protein
VLLLKTLRGKARAHLGREAGLTHQWRSWCSLGTPLVLFLGYSLQTSSRIIPEEAFPGDHSRYHTRAEPLRVSLPGCRVL